MTISKETALLAKEKGFDQPTPVFHTRLESTINYWLPTQEVLSTWLRDLHGLHIIIIPTVTMCWTFRILKVWKKDFDIDEELKIEPPPYSEVHAYDYSTYEQAMEEALREALNHNE